MFLFLNTFTYDWSFNILVLLTSYGTSYLFHLLIKKYVFTIYKTIESNHLLIEKLSFFGIKKIKNISLNDLINGESIFNTWKSVKTGEGFLIQFIPQDQSGNGNVTSYKGEKVDTDLMTKIYNEISSRRWFYLFYILALALALINKTCIF